MGAEPSRPRGRAPHSACLLAAGLQGLLLRAARGQEVRRPTCPQVSWPQRLHDFLIHGPPMTLRLRSVRGPGAPAAWTSRLLRTRSAPCGRRVRDSRGRRKAAEAGEPGAGGRHGGTGQHWPAQAREAREPRRAGGCGGQGGHRGRETGGCGGGARGIREPVEAAEAEAAAEGGRSRAAPLGPHGPER